MGCGSSYNPGTQSELQAARQDVAQQQAIKHINQDFAGFNTPYYQGIQKAYTQWAMPQLQQQYQNANSQLGYKLGNSGMMNSSYAQQAKNALSSNMNQAQINVGNQAVDQANQMRQSVGQQRNFLINAALSATQPASVAQEALQTAQQTQGPSSFAPIGNMLNSFANTFLSAQSANMYNQANSQYLNGFSNQNMFNNSAISGGSLPGNQQ